MDLEQTRMFFKDQEKNQLINGVLVFLLKPNAWLNFGRKDMAVLILNLICQAMAKVMHGQELMVQL